MGKPIAPKSITSGDSEEKLLMGESLPGQVMLTGHFIVGIAYFVDFRLQIAIFLRRFGFVLRPRCANASG
jgi:hypothetical protein